MVVDGRESEGWVVDVAINRGRLRGVGFAIWVAICSITTAKIVVSNLLCPSLYFALNLILFTILFLSSVPLCE